MKGMYKKWDKLSYISLLMPHSRWEVQLKWEGDRCLFTDGWLKFVKESGLEAGDTLVLFENRTMGPHFVNTVICKGEDDLVTSSDGK